MIFRPRMSRLLWGMKGISSSLSQEATRTTSAFWYVRTAISEYRHPRCRKAGHEILEFIFSGGSSTAAGAAVLFVAGPGARASSVVVFGRGGRIFFKENVAHEPAALALGEDGLFEFIEAGEGGQPAVFGRFRLRSPSPSSSAAAASVLRPRNRSFTKSRMA